MEVLQPGRTARVLLEHADGRPGEQLSPVNVTLTSAAVRFVTGTPAAAIDVDATIRSRSEVLANPTVLARDVHRYSADFAPLPSAVEDAIVSALLFIETRCS